MSMNSPPTPPTPEPGAEGSCSDASSNSSVAALPIGDLESFPRQSSLPLSSLSSSCSNLKMLVNMASEGPLPAFHPGLLEGDPPLRLLASQLSNGRPSAQRSPALLIHYWVRISVATHNILATEETIVISADIIEMILRYYGQFEKFITTTTTIVAKEGEATPSTVSSPVPLSALSKGTKTRKSKHAIELHVPTFAKVAKWAVGIALDLPGKDKLSWVHMAYDLKTGKPVTIKFISLNYSQMSSEESKQVRKRLKAFKSEKLRHPHLAKLLAFKHTTEYPILRLIPMEMDVSTDVTVLVMENVGGGHLMDILHYTLLPKTREIVVRTYFQQLISALRTLHDRGIVHGNVKPTNLLLDSSFSLKLGVNSILSQGINRFDAAFSSPEARELQDYSFAGDIYSAGVVLYSLLSDRIFFDDRIVESCDDAVIFWKRCSDDSIPESARDLLSHLLLRKPEDRYTIDQMQQHVWLNQKTLKSDELETIYRWEILHEQLNLSLSSKRAGCRMASFELAQQTLPVRCPCCNKCPEDYMGYPPPPQLVRGDSKYSIFDIYTQKNAAQTLVVIKLLTIHYSGFAQLDLETYSMRIYLNAQTKKGTALVGIFIRAFANVAKRCNVFRFRKLSGPLFAYFETLEFLMSQCAHMFTGLKTRRMVDTEFTEAESTFIESFIQPLRLNHHSSSSHLINASVSETSIDSNDKTPF